MKGCLSLIIKIIIALLVFLGLKYLGIVDFIQDKINMHSDISKEQSKEKVKDIVDLSSIDNEYTIDKTLKILKNRMIIAQHNASGQKMIMIEPKNEELLTKNDINEGTAKEKIDNLVKKYENHLLKFERIETEKKDSFYGIEQSIPYIKIKAEISNLPVKNFEGILGAADLKNGKTLIVISFNEQNKYSQIITEAFFKKVKNAKQL